MPDKKQGRLNWREVVSSLSTLQAQLSAASNNQDYATVDLRDHDEPICIVGLSDLHFASWGTDYATLTRVTDELLSTPNLYAFLLGDEEQMAIKLRNVLEVSDNAIPPKAQHWLLDSWLSEVQHKILAAVWSNHATMREEAGSGYSGAAEILSRRVVYHNHIGHTTVQLGAQEYGFALSHAFRGRTMYNPVHGQQRYLRMEAPNADVCWAGDSHVPGFMKYVERGKELVVINGGTAQTQSGYGLRHFSLKTWPVWPCVVLSPDTKTVTPYWSVGDWLAASGQKAA